MSWIVTVESVIPAALLVASMGLAGCDDPESDTEQRVDVTASDDPLLEMEVVFAEAWCACNWDNGSFTSEDDCVQRHPGDGTEPCEMEALQADGATEHLQCLMDAAVAEAGCVRAASCGDDDALDGCREERVAAQQACPGYPAAVEDALAACRPPEPEPEPYWMVGEDGMIFGIDEQGQASADAQVETAELYAIACDGGAKAWVTGGAGTLLRTEDGGDTWLTAQTNTALDLRAVAQRHGRHLLAVGDRGTVLRSENGGDAWEPLQAPQVDFTGVTATDGDVWLLTSDDGSGWRLTEGEGFVRTLEADVALFGVSADHHGNLAAAVGARGSLWVSVDAGRSWDALDLATSEDLLAVSTLDSGVVLATGSQGGVVRWSPQSTDVRWPASNGAPLYGIHVRGDGVGAAVGATGTILQTTDGGASWTLTPYGLTADLRAVDQPFRAH